MKSNTDGYSIRSLLEIFISKGIISIDDVLRASSEVDLMNSIIKEIHPYKITRTTDGRYCTYVADIKKHLLVLRELLKPRILLFGRSF